MIGFRKNYVFYFVCMLFFFPSLLFALSKWQIIPTESQLAFSAIQNGAPVTGHFNQFSGDIYFDPEHLTESKVTIKVNIASLTTSYKDLTATLMTPEWLNANLFPQATFESHQFIKTGETTYKAKGLLTIRNKTLPITLDFKQLEKIDNAAKIKGHTQINRSAFGVGQGEWASTKEIKDPVNIDFTLSVKK